MMKKLICGKALIQRKPIANHESIILPIKIN